MYRFVEIKMSKNPVQSVDSSKTNKNCNFWGIIIKVNCLRVNTDKDHPAAHKLFYSN